MDKNNDTALHYAAAGGHLNIVKYFIEETAVVPACLGWHGHTPLHDAACYKHLELVRYLVAEQQVDPLFLDENGTSYSLCGW